MSWGIGRRFREGHHGNSDIFTPGSDKIGEQEDSCRSTQVATPAAVHRYSRTEPVCQYRAQFTVRVVHLLVPTDVDVGNTWRSATRKP